MAVPLILHQIWIGPKKMPTKWMDGWRKLNPDMEYNLWTNYHGFRYEKKIRHLIERGYISCATDIMRVEILYDHGGVYVDADSIALKPIQDAPFMNSDFWAVQDYTEWVANGTIGCTPGHPIMKAYIDKIAGPHEYWEYGARMLTDCIGENEVLILPTYKFYPTGWRGQKSKILGKVYAQHVWAHTRGKYEES
jgi:mannosyltransferase OCH1-like enzyme